MIALGDIAERCLRSFGITKERVSEIAGTRDCGCEKRQAALNQLGYAWQRRAMLPYYWAREKWIIAWYAGSLSRLRVASTHICIAMRVLVCGR